MITVDILYDLADDIVRQSLIESISNILDDPDNASDTYLETSTTVAGLVIALEFYSTEQQMDEFYKSEDFILKAYELKRLADGEKENA